MKSEKSVSYFENARAVQGKRFDPMYYKSFPQDMPITLDSLSAMFSGSKVSKDKNITRHHMPADVPGSINANTISGLALSIPSGKHSSSLIFINTNKRILTGKEKKKIKVYCTAQLC